MPIFQQALKKKQHLPSRWNPIPCFFFSLLLVFSLCSPQTGIADCFPKPVKSQLWIIPVIDQQEEKAVKTLLPAILLNEYFNRLTKLQPSLQPKKRDPKKKGLPVSEDPVNWKLVLEMNKNQMITITLYTRENTPVLIRQMDSTPLAETNTRLLPLLMEIAGKVSSKKIQPEKLIPYLNRTTSEKSYAEYALGITALQSPNPDSVLKAKSHFQKSMENDYNYVPAYLGRADSLAKEFLLSTQHEKQNELLRKEIDTTLIKAELLNPVLSKGWREKIQKLLHLKEKNQCL